MSLRSRSRVKASMVLTRPDHLFIHNYIRLLLIIILKLLNYCYLYFKNYNDPDGA